MQNEVYNSTESRANMALVCDALQSPGTQVKRVTRLARRKHGRHRTWARTREDASNATSLAPCTCTPNKITAARSAGKLSSEMGDSTGKEPKRKSRQKTRRHAMRKACNRDATKIKVGVYRRLTRRRCISHMSVSNISLNH